MVVSCAACGLWYNDAARLTICPHPLLRELGWRQIVENYKQERPKAMAQIIVPTVGRVVWYWPRGERQPDQQPWLAHICYVNGDGTVNLLTADRWGVPHPKVNVRLVQDGETPPSPEHYCEFMPFQKGQAARTEAAEAKIAAQQKPRELSQEAAVPAGQSNA